MTPGDKRNGQVQSEPCFRFMTSWQVIYKTIDFCLQKIPSPSINELDQNA